MNTPAVTKRQTKKEIRNIPAHVKKELQMSMRKSVCQRYDQQGESVMNRKREKLAVKT